MPNFEPASSQVSPTSAPPPQSPEAQTVVVEPVSMFDEVSVFLKYVVRISQSTPAFEDLQTPGISQRAFNKEFEPLDTSTDANVSNARSITQLILLHCVRINQVTSTGTRFTGTNQRITLYAGFKCRRTLRPNYSATYNLERCQYQGHTKLKTILAMKHIDIAQPLMSDPGYRARQLSRLVSEP